MGQFLINALNDFVDQINVTTYFQNLDYLLILRNLMILIIFVALVHGLVSIVRIVFSKWLSKVFSFTKTKIDDAIGDALGSLNLLFSFGLSLIIWNRIIELPELIGQIVRGFGLAVVFFFIVMTVARIINKIIDEVLVHNSENNENNLGIPRLDQTVSTFIKISVNVLLWVVAVLILVQNFGFNVTALLGGLGIAGLAIGFAIQSILKDIISFFTIYFDKPFEPGDFIVTEQDKGTVANIGIKSTSINTLQGQQLIIPNTELVSSRINNYGKMETRRIEIEFGVTYETDREKIKQIPKLVEELIEPIENVNFNRCHHKYFGDSALIYQLVYTIDDGDYSLYMDIRQQINFAIMDKFAEINVQMAYPTQKLFVETLDSQK